MSDLSDDQKVKLQEMLDTWEQARMAIRFLTIIGTVLKWIGGLCASLALLWSMWHGGTPK